MANRAAAEKYLLQFVKDIDPSLYNYNLYKTLLDSMSDKDFHEYMVGINDGEKFIVIFKPMLKAKGITVENNLKIAEKYGVKFFEKLIFKEDDGLEYKTDIEYLVVDLPYKRMSQNLVKKINIPEHNKSIDELTFQPTSASKGAKISFPELQVLIGMGLEDSIEELIKYRGGDKRGYYAYNALFMRYGSASIKSLRNYATGVESTKTLKTFLIASHIKATP